MGVAWTCRLVGFAGVVGFFISAFTPLPNLLGGWLSTPPRLGPAEAIVVLGGPESQRRAVHGILLYRQGLAPLVVFSGSILEVHAREALAHDLGLPPAVILTEATAHTTQQEAVRVGALLHARGIRRILLVTDALGMSRARGVFGRAGFDVLPAPATGPGDSPGPPHDQLAFTLSIAEELAAQLYYRLMGYL